MWAAAEIVVAGKCELAALAAVEVALRRWLMEQLKAIISQSQWDGKCKQFEYGAKSNKKQEGESST